MTEVNANFDKTWKEAINDYFESFLGFFFSKIYQRIDWQKQPISLDKELEQITASAQTEKRFADKLFQVWLLDNQEIWILVHIEVQSQYEREFPERMFIYNYRAYDLYHKPVVSLAILGDENKSWRPNCYQYGLEGSQIRLDFSIIKLLDYQWEELEQNNNPFAVIVMAHLKTKATTSSLAAREQWKWTLIRSLYERNFSRKQIVDLFKVIDLMMTLPEGLQNSFEKKLRKYQEERKMPLLSNIERRALERGAKETSQKHIYQILEKRFGQLPENLLAQIQKIEDTNILDELHLESISVNSLTEFQTLIDSSISN
jgi:hypothetical protein